MALLDEFKLRNLFGQEPNYRTPPFIPPHNIPQQQAPDLPLPQDDPYQQHINAMPVRENPSMLRKILAAAASGFANMRTPQNAYGMTESILQAPYMQKLEDWKLKENTLRNQAVMQDRQEKLGLQSENIQRQRERDAEAAEAARLRIAVQQGQLELQERTRDLTDSQRLLKQHEDRLKEIEARTAGQVEVEGVRQPNRIEAIEARGAQTRSNIQARENDEPPQIMQLYDPETGKPTQVVRIPRRGGPAVPVDVASKTGGAGGTIKPPTKARSQEDIRLEVYNKAKRAVANNPEWASFVQINDKTKDVKINDPLPADAWISRGRPPKDVRDKIEAAIYPKTGTTQTESDPKREKAIKVLQDAGKVVNEETISKVMGRL